jgi:preprotein translocase subunit YajC
MSFFQDIPAGSPAPGTPGVVQPSGPVAPQQAPPNMMFTILPMFAIMAVMLFMSSRKQKKEQEARKSLQKGDRVVSQSGLIGELVEIDEKVAKVKLAPGITVQMLPSSLGPMETAKTDTLADLRDAKAVSATDKK